MENAGSLRRRKEAVGDIDLLIAAREAEPVVRAFTQLAGVSFVLAEGPAKTPVRLRAGIRTDLRVLPPESIGAASRAGG